MGTTSAAGRFGLLLCVLLLAAPAAAQQVTLTVLHTNDTHGHLLPFSYPSEVPSGSELAALSVRQDIGGIARRATMVKRLKAELEPKGTAVWLVDAGDFCDGTPFSTEYHGEADVAAMNAAGYDFGTIGNHELNLSLSQLKKVIGMARFPLLCANLTEKAAGRPLVRPSEVRQLGPLKIGIFGLTTREAAGYPAAKEGLTIANEIDTARQMVEQLRREADIVMVISHAGEKTDEELAAGVPGIDIIIGGHSHTRLPAGEFIWRSDDLEKDAVNGTVVVQAYQWGGELGRLDLLFAKDASGKWCVSRYRARLIPVTPDVPGDQTVSAVVSRYWDPIKARFGEVIGVATADFVQRGDDLAQYNLVADAVRSAYGADIEFENMFGVRSPLIKGKLTLADLVDLDPFGNTIVTFRITGRQLKEILLKHKPAVSGLRYRIDGGRLAELTVGGRPVDDNAVYTGVTNSYFRGVALQGIEAKDTGRTRLDAIIEHIRKKGTISPVYDGRRIVVGPAGPQR